MDYFCFSDIHGHKELFDKILTWLNSRNEPWKCYFLGDACDRGEFGYSIIKALLANDRFIYMKGNHEDLFVRAAKALKNYWLDDNILTEEVRQNPYEYVINYSYDCDISLHIRNGGLKTLVDWAADGAPLNIIRKLDALPLRVELPSKIWGKLDLSHAGHPNDDLSESALLWSRDHFNEDFEGGRMIHGHTPIRYLMKYVVLDNGHTSRPAFYANGTKVDIDTACFSSDTITLLNLNTFEQHRFTTLI